MQMVALTGNLGNALAPSPPANFLDLGLFCNQRLAVHDVFNAATPASLSSGLHNSIAGHVAAYLTYWVYSSTCDYDYTGHTPHNPVSHIPISSLLYVVICLSVIQRKTYIYVHNIP